MLTYDYIRDFSETATILIPGTEHRLETAALAIQVKMRGQSSMIDYCLTHTFWVEPETYDVHIHLLSNRHRVRVILIRQ